MFNLICKIKLRGGKLSSASSPASSAPKFFALNHFTSSAANASKFNPENSNQDSFPPTSLQNTREFSPGNPNSVITFFKNHNFSETQISTIVNKWPSVFNYVPESSFRPKIDFLRKLGLSSSDTVNILAKAPYLLERSLENQIIPIVDFLRCFLRSDKDVLLSIIRYPFMLDANLRDTLLHNVGILRFAGVPAYHIASMLKTSPGKLAVKPENFRAIVEELQKLGLKPHRKNFFAGIIVMRQLSSSKWKEKIEFYKRVGWSEYQVLDAFRKHPGFMAASVDKITRSLELLADRMGCDLDSLIKRPQILTLNFERTVVPRCAFYQVLLSKDLVEQGCLLEMMDCLRSLSIEGFVMSHAEKDHKLLKMYIRRFLGLGKSRRSFVEPRF